MAVQKTTAVEPFRILYANFQRDMQLLNAGIMNDWEFRMRWMNEDEATAKAALPKVQDMADEKESEVE